MREPNPKRVKIINAIALTLRNAPYGDSDRTHPQKAITNSETLLT
ncbi:MAG: hypothetical protein ACKN87_15030 [Microcystis aeruginosa]